MSIQHIMSWTVYHQPIPYQYVKFYTEPSTPGVRQRPTGPSRICGLRGNCHWSGTSCETNCTPFLHCGSNRTGGRFTSSCWGVVREVLVYLACSLAPTRWMKAPSGTSSCSAIDLKRDLFAQDRSRRANGGIAGY